MTDILILCTGCFALGWAGGWMHGMEKMHTFWLSPRENERNG